MTNNPHNRLFSHHPLFQLSLAYVGGVVTANFVSTPSFVGIAMCATSSLLALVSFVKHKYQCAGALLLSSLFFAGLALSFFEKQSLPQNSLKQLLETGCIDDRQSVLLTGVLEQPPEWSRERVYLVLRLEEIASQTFEGRVNGFVALSALFKTAQDRQEYKRLQLHYATRIRVKTILNRADQFRNPGVSTFTEYLDRKGLDASSVIKQTASIVRLDDTAVFRVSTWLYSWREAIQQTIDEQFSPETSGVLDAALLGNRHNLSKSTIERFRQGGTFHVLVISGLHISFIGGLVVVLAQRLTRRRSLKFVIASLVVWCYSIAVGAEASVIRASLMFTIVSFGVVIFRSASALNALGAAALIILVNKPSDFFDPSLQLTFLSVFAIVTIAWPLLQNFKAIGSWR